MKLFGTTQEFLNVSTNQCVPRLKYVLQLKVNIMFLPKRTYFRTLVHIQWEDERWLHSLRKPKAPKSLIYLKLRNSQYQKFFLKMPWASSANVVTFYLSFLYDQGSGNTLFLGETFFFWKFLRAFSDSTTTTTTIIG